MNKKILLKKIRNKLNELYMKGFNNVNIST